MQLSNYLQLVGEAVRRHISSRRDVTGYSAVVSMGGGDTIYGIDKRVEPIIHAALEAWPEVMKPLIVIAEGFGDVGRFDIGDTSSGARYRVLIDPIDGTRSLMYDKRSAWFLAAIAPDRGASTRLSDSLAAVMIELPTSKQVWADTLSSERNLEIVGIRSRIDGSDACKFLPKPSAARNLKDGFGQVSSFFPGTKRLAAELMEEIAESTLGGSVVGGASIFDDQYISTGGQFYELISGKDRFCCDLRPLFYEIIERETNSPVIRGLECHPYDIAALLIARKAGVIVTDGYGNALDAPFDVSTGVHWCGYANESLRDLIEPTIKNWLRKKGLKA